MSNDTVSTSNGSTSNGSTSNGSTGKGSANSSAAPAASRKPDAIAREIELTRAELADTIDAIADRISPKRAVSRGRQAVRAQISSVSGRSQDEPTRVISLDEPAASADQPVAGSTPLARLSGPGPAGIDPRLLVAGAVAGVAVGVILLRRKRS